MTYNVCVLLRCQELLLKIALMSNSSKTVTDTRMGSMEVEYETTSGLSIGIMTFDLG